MARDRQRHRRGGSGDDTYCGAPADGDRLPRLVPLVASLAAAALDLLFGLTCGLASLSCTLPIFLAVVGAAITRAQAPRTLSAR